MNQLHMMPDARAGISLNPIKIVIFIKGVFIRSLYYNMVFVSLFMKIAIIAFSMLMIGYFVYTKIKNEDKKNKWNFIVMLGVFYLLAYFPNLISADHFVAYRTLGTITLISSCLLIYSISFLPLPKLYSNSIILLIAIISILSAYYTNKTFTTIQNQEYESIKQVIKEKIKEGYPKRVLVIRADEKYLIKKGIVSDVITDEFGKLSNTVYWTPKPFIQMVLYDLTNNKTKAHAIDVISYTRNDFPTDSVSADTDWVLDIEKIYSSYQMSSNE